MGFSLKGLACNDWLHRLLVLYFRASNLWNVSVCSQDYKFFQLKLRQYLLYFEQNKQAKKMQHNLQLVIIIMETFSTCDFQKQSKNLSLGSPTTRFQIPMPNIFKIKLCPKTWMYHSKRLGKEFTLKWKKVTWDRQCFRKLIRHTSL